MAKNGSRARDHGAAAPGATEAPARASTAATALRRARARSRSEAFTRQPKAEGFGPQHFGRREPQPVRVLEPEQHRHVWPRPGAAAAVLDADALAAQTALGERPLEDGPPLPKLFRGERVIPRIHVIWRNCAKIGF